MVRLRDSGLRASAALPAGEAERVTSPVSRYSEVSFAVSDWLESPYLQRLTSRVAYQYRLRPEEVPDLLQEVRIALWKAGPDLQVNVTWIFHTVQHKAIDLVRRGRQLAERDLQWTEVGFAPTGVDSELLHLLRARAALLPDRLRGFYALRYEQGLSQREVAEKLGLCRGSIRWLDQQCQQRLVKGGA